MRGNESDVLKTIDKVATLLLGLAVLLAVASVAWGLHTQDTTAEWAPKGKRMATEQAALPTNDVMVRIAAGEVLMGSTRQPSALGTEEGTVVSSRLTSDG